MNKKKIYAAYGSNMNINQMKQRCPEARLLTTGILGDYKLDFRGNGVATVLQEAGESAPIVLWEITQGCEKALDIYEGYSRLYEKQELQIFTQGETIEAMAYVMTKRYCQKVNPPSKRYYNIICQGYIENGLELNLLNEAFLRSIGWV